jgi:predicted anti-sigma-YlaC factor YlaD
MVFKMKNLANETAMSCKQASKILSVKRDRPLTDEEELQLKNHLAICLYCRNFDGQLDVLAEMAKRFAIARDL